MSLASLDLFADRASSPILIDAESIVKAQSHAPLDPGDFGTMTSLGYRAARAQMPDWLGARHREMTEDAIERAFKLTGKRIANPHVLPSYSPEERSRRLGQILRNAGEPMPEDRFANRWQAFEREYAELRKQHPELPDPRTFRDTIREEMQKRVRELQAGQRTSTGLGDVGAFVGSMGADIQHPINLMTLPLGAPSALWAPARAGLIAALGQVAKVGGVEALIAAGAQIPIGFEKMDRLPSLGLPYGWPEFGEEVLGAAGMGFLLGSGMRGLVALWRGAREFRARAAGEAALDPVPAGTRLAADDGLRVGERLMMDAEAKPARMDGGAHVEATARAYANAAEGRPADLRDIHAAEARRQASLTPEQRAAAAQEAAERRGEAPAGEVPPPRPEALLARPYALPDGSEATAALAGRGAKLSTVRDALADAAPQWGELRAAIARGEVDPAMDQTRALAEGIRLLADAKKHGDSLVDAVERAAMREQPLSTEGQLFAAALARDPLADKAQPASRAAIAARLRAYAEEARTVAPGAEFADPAAPVAILDRVIGLQREIARKIEAEAKEAPSPEALQAAIVTDAKARLERRDVMLPVGLDDEGKTLFKSGRALLEEAEQREQVAALVLTCATGAAL